MGMVEVFSIPDCLHHTVQRSRHCAEIIYEQNTHFGYVNHKYLVLILFEEASNDYRMPLPISKSFKNR